MERIGAGHNVCLFHSTYGHSASLSYCLCRFGPYYRSNPMWWDIGRRDLYDHQYTCNHQPTHGVWDDRSWLLLHNYSNQQPNQLYCKPTARWPKCVYEHRSDFGNTHRRRDN